MMKNSFTKRFVSLLLVLVLLFTSNSLILNAFSESPLPVGVGVYNHVMTDQESVSTKYVVTFYNHENLDQEGNPVPDQDSRDCRK